MKRIVKLMKIGEIDYSILENLKMKLEQEFQEYCLCFEIIKNKIGLSNSEYDLERDQYYAPKILKKIGSIFQDKEFFRMIGVMNKDIYNKKYEAIFGTANKSPGVGLISVTRLKESFYKESGKVHKKYDSKSNFELRMVKEAIHELGHTFGLIHCKNSCIMQFSNCLADTDKKPSKFCISCQKKLEKFFKKLG